MDIQYAVVLTLAVVAGLVGGVASSWLFLRAPMFAHKTPQVAEVIRAKQFVVVDQDGNMRAELSLNADGKPGMALYDENEKYRVTLGLNKDGEPGLRLYDKDGKTSVMLSLNKDEEPSLWLADKSGKRRAGIGLDNGEPRMAFVGKNGQVLFRAP